MQQNPPAHTAKFHMNWAWLGVVPFLLFALLFLIMPTFGLVVGAFQDKDGFFTLDNLARLNTPSILTAYKLSLEISAASAILGAFFGFFLAQAVVNGRLPAFVRSSLTTFSGVASNFAGVPLAFAFIATLGFNGLLTVAFTKLFGFNPYRSGFTILSFWGLTATYLYFQIPLMVLIILPALDGLKKEWREASDILGASKWQYWRYVAFPVLWPSILGSTLLLFANAFGAIATAYALTGSSFNLVTILLYAQIQGDVLHDQNLGYALALGMIIITGISNFTYIWLRGRAERWIK